MKKILFLSLLVALLGACNTPSSRSVVVDLRNYADLDENTQFMMLFSNPLDTTVQDTIYWTGDKRYRYALADSLQDFLAFVDVYALPENENEYRTMLFSSVVAIDGHEAIVSADNRYTVRLSGTKANNLINDLRTKQLSEEIPQDMDTMTYITDYFLNELSSHPNDLYGTYIYSYLSVIRLGDYEESYNFSACIFAQQIIQEEKEADTYLSKHNVAIPVFERVAMIGDISATLILEFERYMNPYILYAFMNPPTKEYTQPKTSNEDVIYIVVDSLNQVFMGKNRDALQMMTRDELDVYFSQDLDPSVIVHLQAYKEVPMSIITEIKQIIRKHQARRISYSTLKN